MDGSPINPMVSRARTCLIPTLLPTAAHERRIHRDAPKPRIVGWTPASHGNEFDGDPTATALASLPGSASSRRSPLIHSSQLSLFAPEVASPTWRPQIASVLPIESGWASHQGVRRTRAGTDFGSIERPDNVVLIASWGIKGGETRAAGRCGCAVHPRLVRVAFHEGSHYA